jgi:hypothetical protein
MSGSQGFITNPAQVVGITSGAYGPGIRLAVDATADPKSTVIPQGAYLSHVEINADQTAGATAQIRGYMSWDEDGDDLFLGPSALADIAPGFTDPNRVNVSIKADAWFNAPTPQTEIQEIWLWLQTDAGTIEVDAGNVRLQWVQGANRP